MSPVSQPSAAERPWEVLKVRRSRLAAEYRHVSVRGRFHHDKEQYLYAPTPAGLAAGMSTRRWRCGRPGGLDQPRLRARCQEGPCNAPRGSGVGRGGGARTGKVTLAARGCSRPRTMFTGNLWYWPDIGAMTAAAFPDGPQKRPGGPQRPEALPLRHRGRRPAGAAWRASQGRRDAPGLPNRHLEYALTWYGLALTLIGVYSAFAINRLRASGRA